MFDLAGNAMTQAQMKDTIADIDPFLTFLEPMEGELDIDPLLAGVAESKSKHDTSGFILDPWNELEHQRPNAMTETEYIGQCLTKLRNFARMNHVLIIVVAHPTKLQRDKESGKYPIPTPYDISGSAAWRNKADNCISIYRDMETNDVELHVQKIRFKHVGQIGMTKLIYHKTTGEYE